jgi:hypothetical protein
MESFLLVVKITGMLGRTRKQSLTASSTFLPLPPCELRDFSRHASRMERILGAAILNAKESKADFAIRCKEDFNY